MKRGLQDVVGSPLRLLALLTAILALGALLPGPLGDGSAVAVGLATLTWACLLVRAVRRRGPNRPAAAAGAVRRPPVARDTRPPRTGTAVTAAPAHPWAEPTPSWTRYGLPSALVTSARTGSAGQPAPPRASQPRAGLFSYVDTDVTPAWPVEGPYAVIDVETTGFSPELGDRVIEVAISRIGADGEVQDEYSTLVNPEGREPGATWLHRISEDDVRSAPVFGEIAGEILTRLDGAVIVAHNAGFEERFLAAEFARSGFRAQPLPALCTLWLGLRSVDAPNHKLRTLCAHHGIPLDDAHTALSDVRAVSRLLPVLLETYGRSLWCAVPPGYGLGIGFPVGVRSPQMRPVETRAGTDRWMASLLTRIPMTPSEASDPATVAYLDAVTTVVEDGRVVGPEARVLAEMLAAAGLQPGQVSALNQRFVESMREAAALADALTPTELNRMRSTATALGVDGYFDDLFIMSGAELGASALAGGVIRRCGACRRFGHYRSRCPTLS